LVYHTNVREGHGWRLIWNTLLGRIFERDREELTGSGRNYYNEELQGTDKYDLI
jgi:hypothetical protein